MEDIQIRQGVRPAAKYTRLAAHLIRYGISKIWLAKRSGIHRRTISLYCRGIRQPTRGHMSRLTSALGIPAIWIWDARHPAKQQRNYVLQIVEHAMETV